MEKENSLIENYSYQIYPKNNFLYKEQNIITPDPIEFLGNKIYVTNKKDYKLAEEIIINLKEDSIEKKAYKSFIDFLTDY